MLAPETAELRRDFDRLNAFLAYFVRKFFASIPVPEGGDVLSQAARTERESGFSAAYRGTIQAVNDIVEATKRMSLEEVLQLDGELASQDLPLLSEVRHRYSKSFVRLMRTGEIKTTEQYYMAIGILNSPGELDTTTRSVLAALVATYETAAPESSRRRS